MGGKTSRLSLAVRVGHKLNLGGATAALSHRPGEEPHLARPRETGWTPYYRVRRCTRQSHVGKAEGGWASPGKLPPSVASTRGRGASGSRPPQNPLLRPHPAHPAASAEGSCSPRRRRPGRRDTEARYLGVAGIPTAPVHVDLVLPQEGQFPGAVHEARAEQPPLAQAQWLFDACKSPSDL